MIKKSFLCKSSSFKTAKGFILLTTVNLKFLLKNMWILITFYVMTGDVNINYVCEKCNVRLDVKSAILWKYWGNCTQNTLFTVIVYFILWTNSFSYKF